MKIVLIKRSRCGGKEGEREEEGRRKRRRRQRKRRKGGRERKEENASLTLVLAGVTGYKLEFSVFS